MEKVYYNKQEKRQDLLCRGAYHGLGRYSR